MGGYTDAVHRAPGVNCWLRQYGRQTRKGLLMALFMDVHNLTDSVTVSDVSAAHAADLATQDAYGVHYLRYWVDEKQGKIFCLVDAGSAEAANTVHREAHGLVADEIYPVVEGD